MNDIESRELTLLQFETFPDFLDIAGSTFNRRKLTGDSVNVFRGNASRLQPAFFCELEVALRIGGRHASFIYPKNVDSPPVERCLGQSTEHQLRRGASGNRDPR